MYGIRFWATFLVSLNSLVMFAYTTFLLCDIYNTGKFWLPSQISQRLKY